MCNLIFFFDFLHTECISPSRDFVLSTRSFAFSRAVPRESEKRPVGNLFWVVALVFFAFEKTRRERETRKSSAPGTRITKRARKRRREEEKERERSEREREREKKRALWGVGRVVVLSRDGAELLSVSSSSSSSTLFQSANEARKRAESSADSQIREKRSPFFGGTSRIGSRSDEQQRAIV